VSVECLNKDNGSSGRLASGMTRDLGFYRRRGKRMFDAFISSIALLFLSPLFLVIALLIKLTSKGPVIYFQQRVGREGRLFQIAKFRSMRNYAEQCGSRITWRGDVRVTRIGKILRFLKIDELPQLWNVVRGEMSLVGPRPEVPHYVGRYDARQREVLTVRPGMTDLASIHFRKEEHILSQSPDPERFYEDVILPHKLALNLHCLKKASFSYDLWLIAKTLSSICFSQTTSAI
jgi:lipopolysaccharide/colanic/teichoic acid biosynthesis glycosyltransferase